MKWRAPLAVSLQNFTVSLVCLFYDKFHTIHSMPLKYCTGNLLSTF